jgi:general secretion pathway protein A
MYTKYFGLEKKPFVLTPDPGFLFFSREHDLALAHLEYGLMNNAGFMALTGEVGAGKTTLLKYLFNKVDGTLCMAMVFNTQLDSRSLLDMIAREFELSPGSNIKTDLLTRLHEHFLRQYSGGKRCLIVVDEAQNLSLDAFEELRMLSNLDAENESLVQIILVGQPQLKDRLAHPNLAQLTQRISVYFHLSPLGSNEVAQYIEHRLKIAGHDSSKPLFTEDAVHVIVETSRGIPRVINSICESSLTYAFADDAKLVGVEIVQKVISDNPLLSLQLHRAVALQVANPGSKNGDVQSMPADFQLLLPSVMSRLQELEMRIQRIEQPDRDQAIGILESKLTREQEHTRKLGQKLVSLTKKYREIENRHEMRSKQPSENTKVDWSRFWKFWSRND